MREEKILLRRMLRAKPGLRAQLLEQLSEAEARALDADWPVWLHEGRAPPEGDDWRVWLMHGGRGSGKTRAGAEWVSALAREQPDACFALVAANIGEARRVMVERPRSGLLAVATPKERAKMVWEPSNRKLVFASGATASIYSGADGDSLRGFEHHYAWCDELAKWKDAESAWHNLLFGLRCGERPRVLVTTTPRAMPLLRAIVGEEGAVRSRASTDDNPHLPDFALSDLRRRYAGTRLGRQELDGELIEDLEGALWEREMIEERRAEAVDRLVRVVVGVDPPASVEGTCGIVVCGTDEAGRGYVLADLSVSGVSPEGWARKVAAAADAWGAEKVVAEANNGGAMVGSVLKGAEIALPVELVHAVPGKVARAAPVGTLFESGRAWFAGRFPALEDELAGLTWDGRYHGPGSSPDRADAMVWAMTELMLGKPPRVVRIRRL